MIFDPNARHHHSLIEGAIKRGARTLFFTDRKGHIIGNSKLTRVNTNENQEPQQTQLPDDIEVTPYIDVTPPEYITDIGLVINTNNEATTIENTPNTLEPPQLLESLGTTE